jgi:hypothetical protein
VGAARFDEAQPVEGVVSRFRTGDADDGPVSVGTVVDRLAGGVEKGLVDLRIDAPGRTGVGEWLARREL